MEERILWSARAGDTPGQWVILPHWLYQPWWFEILITPLAIGILTVFFRKIRSESVFKLCFGVGVGLVFGLVAGCRVGLVAGPLACLTAGLLAGLWARILAGFATGVVFGLWFGLVAGLTAGLAAGPVVGLTTGLWVGLGIGPGLLAAKALDALTPSFWRFWRTPVTYDG